MGHLSLCNINYDINLLLRLHVETHNYYNISDHAVLHTGSQNETNIGPLYVPLYKTDESTHNQYSITHTPIP